MSRGFLGIGIRWMMMEDTILGLCLGAEGQMPSQPAFEAAHSCGLWMGCEGETVPAAATGERTETAGLVRFAGNKT